ncbi:MAG: hypothetical protein QOD63_2209 [Actinomycetota bacterium]|jgi:hypothetical protein|nr:hypothetical protein [Actinomycetota bacterium]
MALVVTNGAAMAARFEAEAAAIGPKVAAELDVLTHTLAEDWRSHVKHVTGASAATIGVSDGMAVGTAPDLHRLEVGFHGADSLGRIYDQAAQPALGPAFDRITPAFDEAIDPLVAGLLDGI